MNTQSLFLRRSCVANFKTFYGIGTIKAKSLSRFLLNHPVQDQFTINFDLIRYPTTESDIWLKIPRDNKIRHLVQHFFQIKFEAFCYQSLRLFQNFLQKDKELKLMPRLFIIRIPINVYRLIYLYFLKCRYLIKD